MTGENPGAVPGAQHSATPTPEADLPLIDVMAALIGDAFQRHDHTAATPLIRGDGHCVPCWLTARNAAPAILRAVRPMIERVVQQRIHDRIIAELVCCHVYDGQNPDKAEKSGHAICYWGGAAAQLALDPPAGT